MRVLYVTSEAFPLVKTGGLADVSAALPAALNNLNVDTRLLLPGYPQAVARASSLQEIARPGDLLGCGETRLLAGRLPTARCLSGWSTAPRSMTAPAALIRISTATNGRTMPCALPCSITLPP